MKVSEFDLITKIQDGLVTTNSKVLHGIGDDCAVIAKDSDTVSLVSTDSLLEGVHFDLRYFSFIDLGKKSLSVSLSDVAAMGGSALCAFVALGIPHTATEEQVCDFYAGLDQVAREFSVVVAGGDVSRSQEKWFVNITVMGEAPRGQYKLRSTAQPGDGIYVSGTIGTAALGLQLLEKRKTAENIFVQTLRNPRPRLVLAQILSELSGVRALIDTSDGLLQDLQHILKASEVGACVSMPAIPQADGFASLCADLRLDARELLLGGGEDYQLLFTMDPSSEAELRERLSFKKNIRITKIGEVVAASAGLTVVDEKGLSAKLPALGYDHFIDDFSHTRPNHFLK